MVKYVHQIISSQKYMVKKDSTKKIVIISENLCFFGLSLFFYFLNNVELFSISILCTPHHQLISPRAVHSLPTRVQDKLTGTLIMKMRPHHPMVSWWYAPRSEICTELEKQRALIIVDKTVEWLKNQILLGRSTVFLNKASTANQPVMGWWSKHVQAKWFGSWYDHV